MATELAPVPVSDCPYTLVWAELSALSATQSLLVVLEVHLILTGIGAMKVASYLSVDSILKPLKYA